MSRGLLCLVCQFRHTGSGSVGHICWVRFAGSGFLGQFCWVRFAGSAGDELKIVNLLKIIKI